MFIVKCLSLLLLAKVYFVDSQSFLIGILDQDVFSYLQSSVLPNFTLVKISLPSLSTAASYGAAINTLSTVDVLIGRFNYSVASICQQLNLTYFYLDNIVQTFPGTLLELNNDLIMEAQMLLIYLVKYNINFPLRFISDGSTDVLKFRFGLGETSVSQCIFNQNANTLSINQCYQSVFQGNIKSNYIFMTDPNSTTLLDTYLQQSLYMSLPFSSMILLPMVDILPIINKYYYSGGYLLEVTPELPIINQNGTLILRNALIDLFQVMTSLTNYTKLNNTYWINNNITSAYNNNVILGMIKAKNGIYQPDGQKTSKSYYIYTLSSGVFTMVSTFVYNSVWNEIKNIPNPATAGSKGFINVVYFADPVFLTEVPGVSGVTIQGYTTELFNNILPAIGLTFNANKLSSVPIVGRLANNTFTGMLGAMSSGNFIMTAFPVPNIRSYGSLLYYSNKIAEFHYSILIKQAEKTVDYVKLSKPYSYLVWLTIIATLIVLSIILFLINLISPNISNSTDKLTISNSIFMVFGSVLIAKMLVKPNMFSTQIFYLIIWLGTLLLISSYVANLYVEIAFTNNTQIQFTTVQSLWDQKNYKWTFVKDSYLYNSIMDDIEKNLSSLFVQMYKYSQINWANQSVTQQQNVEAFAFNFSNFVVLNDDIHNLKISLQNCSLTTIVDTTLTYPLVYVINSSFQYIREFSIQIMTIRENGILDILATKYFMTGSCPTTLLTNSQINPFDYGDMSGIFILIIIGIFISLIVAGIEFILSKGNLQCQRVVTGNSLQFGKVYKAKVKTLDKNGVTVDIGRQSLFSRKNDARIYYVHKRFLGTKVKNNAEVPSPTDQGIMIGTTLFLKYLGNSPDDSKRKFIQVVNKRK